MVSNLCMRGEIIRRINLSPFPRHSERDTPKYHAPIWSYAPIVYGIPVQTVVSYEQGHTFIPTLSTQSLPSIPTSPINPMDGEKSLEQSITKTIRTILNHGHSIALGNPLARLPSTTTNVIFPSSLMGQLSSVKPMYNQLTWGYLYPGNSYCFP